MIAVANFQFAMIKLVEPNARLSGVAESLGDGLFLTRLAKGFSCSLKSTSDQQSATNASVFE
jgi:hypothetical protein